MLKLPTGMLRLLLQLPPRFFWRLPEWVIAQALAEHVRIAEHLTGINEWLTKAPTEEELQP